MSPPIIAWDRLVAGMSSSYSSHSVLMVCSYGQEILDNGAANNNIKDINMALSWVTENIGAFGGDADRVTSYRAQRREDLLILVGDIRRLFCGSRWSFSSTSRLFNSSNRWCCKCLLTQKRVGSENGIRSSFPDPLQSIHSLLPTRDTLDSIRSWSI